MDVESKENAPHIETLESFNPDLKVLSFDIENSINNGNILTICYVIRENDSIRNGKPIYGTEQEIIDTFTKVIQDEDPDVITGYNIDNYDIPTLLDRAKASNAGKLTWGRTWATSPGRPARVEITGRLVVVHGGPLRSPSGQNRDPGHVAMLCLVKRWMLILQDG